MARRSVTGCYGGTVAVDSSGDVWPRSFSVQYLRPLRRACTIPRTERC